MRRRAFFASALGVTALAGLAGGCSPLALFNDLAPRDRSARLVRKDARFGPHPRQALDLYAPLDAPRASLPLLVFFYGGSWRHGDKDLYRWAGQALAARGFVVAIPNYRLVPEVVFPTFLQDCALGVAEARRLAPALGADPDRVVLAGHSAGAYNAVMLALDPTWLRGAGVEPAVVRAAAGLSGPYDFYPFDGPVTIATFGQAKDPRLTQPVNLVRPDAPALFLATGDRDELVRPQNARILAERERAAGGEAVWRVYPGLNHNDTVLALSRPFRNKAPLLDDMAAFLHRAAERGWT